MINIILLTIIAMMIVRIIRLKRKVNIYYNNYQQTLRALQDDDKDLTGYLERKNK